MLRNQTHQLRGGSSWSEMREINSVYVSLTKHYYLFAKAEQSNLQINPSGFLSCLTKHTLWQRDAPLSLPQCSRRTCEWVALWDAEWGVAAGLWQGLDNNPTYNCRLIVWFSKIIKKKTFGTSIYCRFHSHIIIKSL